MDKDFKVIIDCPLCGENELQVLKDDGKELMQCINCGYSTSDSMAGTKETCESYKDMDSNLKKWAREAKGYVWVPSVLNLDIGILYPVGENKENLKWGFAPLVQIPEEEQKNYPVGDGTFYKTKYDTEKEIHFDGFAQGLLEIDMVIKAKKKAESEGKTVGIKLPDMKNPSVIGEKNEN
tara:strand:+ start:3316 stop:3852 length:537 start_codon:yes stop_codon:yes gene_type:complete